MTRPRIAVVLSGCGVYDGSEIHEAVLSLLAIDRRGADYQCFAPDIAQHHVVNHLTGEATDEQRNCLVESARIARGDVLPLAEYRAEDYDALFFPGGFGAAKNLSSVAFDGADADVEPEVARAVRTTHASRRPIGALCISPAMIARLLPGATVTVGRDAATAEVIKAMGGHHVVTGHGEVTVDRSHRLVTSPCYMLESRIGQIAAGADAAVAAVLELIAAA